MIAYLRRSLISGKKNLIRMYSAMLAAILLPFSDNSTTLFLIARKLNPVTISNTNGFITSHYSPQSTEERKFFTVDNAKRIDYIRNKLESIKHTISDDEYKFILASAVKIVDQL